MALAIIKLESVAVAADELASGQLIHHGADTLL